MLKDSWKKLLTMLIVSVTFNVGFLITSFYLAWEKKEEATKLKMRAPLVDSRVDAKAESISSGAILSQFFQMPYELLIKELSNHELVEHGYRRRDFALACLVEFYYFPIDKVILKEDLQRRRVYFEHNEGERVELTLFASLKDQHYSAIKQFFVEELWPFSTEGLFIELKRRGKGAEESLKQAFYATAEFRRMARLFEKSGVLLDKEELKELLLLSEYDIFCSANSLKNLLKSMINRHSSGVASLLFWIERDLRSCSDEEILELVEVANLDLAWVKEGFSKLLEAPRSDLIKEKVFAKTAVAKREKKAPVADFKPKETVVTDRLHKVEPGQTLWQIARLYKVSVERLAEINQMNPSQVLSVGKELLIPSSDSSTGS